jgi:predicted ATP-binding protein involved in virulence
MSEKITIKNFGGLDEVTIPLNSINIFIGKQASGKSVSAKLIYFFKTLPREIFNGVEQGKTKPEINNFILRKFEEYFPLESWANDFEIAYFFGNENIKLKKEPKTKLLINYSDGLAKLFSASKRIIKKHNEKEIGRERYNSSLMSYLEYSNYLRKDFGVCASNNQIFVPAGRSFFANLQSTIFSLLAGNKTIDPFLIEFGAFYERMKSVVERNLSSETKKEEINHYVNQLISKIINGEYKREKNKDFILHKDKRKVNVSFSSSGQQEILPLFVTLKAQTIINYIGGGATVYIEEPEAHLFPSAQKSIIELIAAVYNNSDRSLQFVITTHSPYILSAFNNLLQAGHLREEGKSEKEIEKIVSKFSIIKPKELNAFEMRDGKLINLIDEEFGLITATTLDQASEDISKEFDALLNLE